ncbi:MAG: tRNA preQ1(34) S-adenosylmethionine ribosyltransferase-isomerase QueA [Treponema sp.]|jgi:S-adenosylmethionine:tRNA ribosyltransferase-isomerase|nr:tRNA preQ1(34) S-adenosylmethionine ribosyltransferase-isomerase QueA [Treponema sp.]
MKRGDFFFELPERLIARYPPAQRGQDRLMVLDRSKGSLAHCMVGRLPELLEPGSVLVFNNSRVRKARLYGISRSSGAKTQFLLVKRLDPQTWKVMVQRAKRRRPGSAYEFFDAQGRLTAEAEITGCDGDFRLLRFDRVVDDGWLETYGHIPLPPYIKREDTPADSERYQTVYSKSDSGKTGNKSIAAPTAGLHFTEELLGRLRGRGLETAFITLHVGLGTFLPVRADTIEDHLMHEEEFSIGEETASLIDRARVEGRKIIAVGTTSVRTLESAWENGFLRRGEGSTSIFIYPGYTFKVVDALFTNFHTPESTLLMLVSAFAGRELIMESYREAVLQEYRFYSYGDAMLIL